MSLYLILVNIVCQLSLSELIKCHNDKSHENVDEEEGKHDKVDDVVNCHLSSEPRKWTLVLVCRGHGILQNSGIRFD